MRKFNEYEDDFRDEFEDIRQEDTEAEEDEGFLSFKTFLLKESDFLDEKHKKQLKRSTSQLYVLWDIYKDDYIDYCEENGYEHENLDEE